MLRPRWPVKFLVNLLADLHISGQTWANASAGGAE
jgi:hypothetical protein